MSGDVQARKRKDKRKRKDEETVKEPVKPKPAVPGVHATKMGPNDIHLHVQKDTATGGHWCAKIVFFFLMATLLGLIGLIIMENRGLADLDTPLSESRYADILEGWVDETREEHDDHVPLTHDEHDDDDDEHDDKDDNEHDNSDEEHADHHEDDDDDDEEEEEDDTKDVSEEDDDDEKELSYFERVRRMIDLTSSDKDDDKDEGEEIEKDDQKDEALDDDDDEEVVDNENDDDVDDDDEENEELEDEFAQDLSNEEDEKDDGDDEIEKAYDENDEKANNFDEDELDDKKDEGFIDDDEEDDKRDDGDNEDDVETSDNVNSNVNKLNDPEDDNGPESNDGNQKDFVEQLEELAIPEIEEQPTDENSDAPQQDASEGTSQIRTGGPQTLNEDDLFEEELRRANDMLENNPKFALTLFVRLRESHPNNPQIIYGEALAVDLLATDEKSNKLVLKAIETFLILFRLEDKIYDNEMLQDAANKCIDRMRFIGQYGKAIPVHNMLIERYPDIPDFRNNLAVTYLYLNKMDEAQHVLHETLLMWPRNGFALVHYGFILKIHNKELEEAISFMREGIETGEPGTVDGRFYFHLGDALYRLGKHKKAYHYYEEGAKKKLFLSKYQRSLYNVNRLQSRPFWKKIDTTYKGYFDILETNFNVIRAEGMKLLNSEGYFKNETEDLRDQGDWKQFDLYSRGKRNNENCNRTPITCKIIETFPAARTCTRGQVKFSVMLPGTHVWPHCGPTNCRLRAHLGLKVPPNTFIRVADETRTWEEGKMLIFDDSFEHEVWHNGTSVRLVLIVDVWHPDLTETERNNLVPI